ncbi:hypothetical protein [Cohnella laeviribosi]|uniref:hypothetical protein n=1 Tax=Cohnella laeviribosi TaxID=380174 RepID=UPI00037A511F|nr:hypothetical protein [Cohnella laeviribosi]
MSYIFKSIMTILILAIVSACGHEKGGEIQTLVPPSSNTPTINKDVDPPTKNEKPPATQASFSLPDGYQIVEASTFTFAIPNSWHVEQGSGKDAFSFQKNGEQIGETEILGWFDSETWKNFKPNHAEQTDFKERNDLLAIKNKDVHLYKIQLTHTKPAADKDPEWKYKETRWYVSVKEDGRSYGFYFNSEKIDENVMETILSSFRLKKTK